MTGYSKLDYDVLNKICSEDFATDIIDDNHGWNGKGLSQNHTQYKTVRVQEETDGWSVDGVKTDYKDYINCSLIDYTMMELSKYDFRDPKLMINAVGLMAVIA